MLYPILTLLAGFSAFFPVFQDTDPTNNEASFQTELHTDRQRWTAYERVFSEDLNMISELTWQTGWMPLQGLELRYSPHGHGTFMLKHLQTPDHHDGTMSDEDWDDFGTSESYSTSTARLLKAQHTDFAISLPFAAYTPEARAFWLPEHVNLSLLTGFHVHKTSWEPYGLDLVQTYLDENGEKQTWTYNIPHDQLIGQYEAGALAPYVGLSIDSFFNRFTVTTNIRYSDRVKHEDLDVHGLRGLVFHDKTGYQGTWLGFDMQAKYHMSEHWSLTTGYTFDHFKPVRGKTDLYDMETEELLFKNIGSSGFESKHRGLMFGLQYAF